jgi:hypothetical protein
MQFVWRYYPAHHSVLCLAGKATSTPFPVPSQGAGLWYVLRLA